MACTMEGSSLVPQVSLMRLYLRMRYDMLAHALQAMCMTNRALYNKYVHVTLQISHLADAKPNVRQTITHAQAKV